MAPRRRLAALIALAAALIAAAALPYGAAAAERKRRPTRSPWAQQLFAATRQGDLGEVEMLLERRQEAGDLAANDIDSRDAGSGQTALMASCLYGHGEITAALLDAGADPMVGEQDGFTPAHGAAFQGKVGPMRVLIERGLDWTSFHEDGYAPLHRVLWKGTPGHVETLKLMIESGVDVNLPDRKEGNGWTPLHLALRTRNWHATHVLAGAGAQATARERAEHAETWEKYLTWRDSSGRGAPDAKPRRRPPKEQNVDAKLMDELREAGFVERTVHVQPDPHEVVNRGTPKPAHTEL